MQCVFCPTIIAYAMTRSKILYVDMDGVLADFWGRITELHPELHSMEDGERRGDYIDHLLKYHSPDMFDTLDLMEPGAIHAYKTLASVYDTYILSTASWVAPLSYTHKRLWVERHIGDVAHKRLILSNNKGLLKGDYLIDDRIANGVDQFEGEHIHFGQADFPDWGSVITYLRNKDNW